MSKLPGKYFPALVLMSLVLPLLAMGYLGQYSRYMADDYCTTARALSKGVFGSMLWWYNNWAGQFTNWIVKGVTAFLGTGFTSLLPALVLVGWVTVSIWALYQFMRFIRLPRPRLSACVLGLLIVYAVFDGTPSPIQSLYWIGAAIPYTMPLILMTFLAGYIIGTLRPNPQRAPLRAVIIVAFITFIAGGLSEVYVAFQTAALGLAFLAVLVFAPSRYKRPALLLLSTGIVCSLAALFIIAVAPGNAVRRESFPSLTLPMVAWKTFYTTLAFPFIAAGRFSTLPLIVAVLLPLLYCYGLESVPAQLRLSSQMVRRMLLLSALVTFILTAACLAPPIQGTGNPPAARAYVIPQFILVMTAVFWGCVMGLSARRSQPRVSPAVQSITALIIVALLIIGPLASASQILADVPDFRTYANEWDSRDTAIRTAARNREKQIETTMLKTDIGIRAGLEPIGPEAGTGVNTCAAAYYGIDSLTARTPIQMGDKSR